MSGNIFVSSTVPGIKDRDRDKQVVALYGQSYYLTRTDFTTTYWVKLMIGSTLLMLVVPIFLARLFFSVIHQPESDSPPLLARIFPPALRPGQGHDIATFTLAEIPVSAVLAQALATINNTRSRGLMAQVLLELQNPELTSFAGPGYGIYLKNQNRGARLEVFPDGKLPRCGFGGRYDDWTRVKGLRYAYQWITTTSETSLVRSDVYGDNSGAIVAESLLMAWPALLLERARVHDPLNPTPPGSQRNVYGEAVDRLVASMRMRGSTRTIHAEADNTLKGTENTFQGDDENGGSLEQQTMLREKYVEASQIDGKDRRYDLEATFTLPPFLALYAVARNEADWLVQAADQIMALLSALDANLPNDYDSQATNETTELPYEDVLAEGNDFTTRLQEVAWTLAGTVRVLRVLEIWHPGIHTVEGDDSTKRETWRGEMNIELQDMANKILLRFKEYSSSMKPPLTSVITHGNDPNDERCEEMHVGMQALLVSSIYRLAQSSRLNEPVMLDWADQLYEKVAACVNQEGQVMVASSADAEKPNRPASLLAGETHNIILMMWAARRDCAKVGACRTPQSFHWWQKLISWSS